MPTLQCPKCKQPIEIKSMPADNRVKCGSCSAEFSLKAPAKPAGQAKSDSAKAGSDKANKTKASATSEVKSASGKPTSGAKTTSTKPTSAKPATTSSSKSSSSSTASATAQADDPFAAIDLNSLGKSKRVDLGVAPVQSGAMESPSGGMAPWLPGNAPAYVPISQTDAAAAAKGGGKPGKDAGKNSPAAKKSNLGVTIAVITILVMMAGGSIVAAIIVASK